MNLKEFVNRGPVTLMKSRKEWLVIVTVFLLNYLKVDPELIGKVFVGMQSLVMFLMSVEKNIKVKNGGKK